MLHLIKGKHNNQECHGMNTVEYEYGAATYTQVEPYRPPRIDRFSAEDDKRD